MMENRCEKTGIESLVVKDMEATPLVLPREEVQQFTVYSM
jgi:hypothetical protein